MKTLFVDLKLFFSAYGRFFSSLGKALFWQLEKWKKILSSLLYRQRGRFAQPFSHLWLGILLTVGIFVSPQVEERLRGEAMGWEEVGEGGEVVGGAEYLTASTYALGNLRGKVIEYTVGEGETVSSIAKKFDLSIDTVLWANSLTSTSKIKVGQKLKIPPVSGIVHTVGRGETVYLIAKKYGVDPQNIVDFPFNSFANDETFALAISQTVFVPDGVMPKAVPVAPRRVATVDIGTATKGNFIWPTSGTISQRFSWYHPAIDVANKSAPAVIAADGGQVVSVVYQEYAYGHHVIIDHGNGFRTLYAHMNNIYVSEGSVVSQGQSIGQMGSTGRSTGTHLHFEIIKDGVKQNPLVSLQ